MASRWVRITRRTRRAALLLGIRYRQLHLQLHPERGNLHAAIDVVSAIASRSYPADKRVLDGGHWPWPRLMAPPDTLNRA
jgi:hypothetical protein